MNCQIVGCRSTELLSTCIGFQPVGKVVMVRRRVPPSLIWSRGLMFRAASGALA
ncbi:MAG: hypothetical protein Q613_PSC00277G0001, partial [Propionibacterium sp. DORA_15]